MAKPNLAYIPATIGDKVYSILPNDSVGDFDFDRASTATRINAQGLIETVASGENRLNYPLLDGEVVGCPHLLLEPQRTNLVTYSEDFSQWNLLSGGTGVNPVVTSDSTISPDGTQNADKIVFNSGSGTTSGDSSQINNIVSVTSGTDATASVYLKGENGGEELVFRGVADGSYQKITLTTEWQRFSTTENSGTTTDAITFGIRQNVSGLGVINSSATIYAWGGQVEVGSYPTSYIKTTSAAVTRAAETCNGSGNAATFNDSEGVLMAEISALAETGRIALNDGTANNNVRFSYDAGANRIDGIVFNGVNQFVGQYTLPTQGSFNKISLKYKPNDFALWVNGFKVDYLVGSGATFSEGTLSELDFDAGNGLVPFYGNTKQIQYFDTTDIDLEQLTSWDSFRAMAEGQLYTIE